MVCKFVIVKKNLLLQIKDKVFKFHLSLDHNIIDVLNIVETNRPTWSLLKLIYGLPFPSKVFKQRESKEKRIEISRKKEKDSMSQFPPAC